MELTHFTELLSKKIKKREPPNQIANYTITVNY